MSEPALSFGEYRTLVERAPIAERSPAQFTHGLCPACLERHFPE